MSMRQNAINIMRAMPPRHASTLPGWTISSRPPGKEEGNEEIHDPSKLS